MYSFLSWLKKMWVRHHFPSLVTWRNLMALENKQQNIPSFFKGIKNEMLIFTPLQWLEMERTVTCLHLQPENRPPLASHQHSNLSQQILWVALFTCMLCVWWVPKTLQSIVQLLSHVHVLACTLYRKKTNHTPNALFYFSEISETAYGRINWDYEFLTIYL